MIRQDVRFGNYLLTSNILEMALVFVSIFKKKKKLISIEKKRQRQREREREILVISNKFISVSKVNR